MFGSLFTNAVLKPKTPTYGHRLDMAFSIQPLPEIDLNSEDRGIHRPLHPVGPIFAIKALEDHPQDPIVNRLNLHQAQSPEIPSVWFPEGTNASPITPTDEDKAFHSSNVISNLWSDAAPTTRQAPTTVRPVSWFSLIPLVNKFLHVFIEPNPVLG